MYIVNRGTALFGGRPKHAGSCWGEDILLPGPQLQLDFSAVAISYLWVFTIDGATADVQKDTSGYHQWPIGPTMQAQAAHWPRMTVAWAAWMQIRPS